MGMDNDPVNLIFSAIRVALADYTGEHIATDFSDIIFGTPQPVVSEANMGVLDPDQINFVLHGHNPLCSHRLFRAGSRQNGSDGTSQYRNLLQRWP